VPSHTIEYWARDWRVAAASFWAAGEAGAAESAAAQPQQGAEIAAAASQPPAQFVHAFEAAQSTNPRAAFAALDMQTSISHARFDLALHGSAACVQRILEPAAHSSSGGGGGGGGGGDQGVVGDYRSVPRLGDVHAGIARAAAVWAARSSSSSSSSSGGGGSDDAERGRILALLREQGVALEELCLVRRMPAAGDAAGEAALSRGLAVPLGDALPELAAAAEAAAAAEGLVATGEVGERGRSVEVAEMDKRVRCSHWRALSSSCRRASSASLACSSSSAASCCAASCARRAASSARDSRWRASKRACCASFAATSAASSFAFS
jgi:hypothetical protein